MRHRLAPLRVGRRLLESPLPLDHPQTTTVAQRDWLEQADQLRRDDDHHNSPSYKRPPD